MPHLRRNHQRFIQGIEKDMTNNVTELDRRLAEGCLKCPVCRHARKKQRGLAFGLHRAGDTAGAFIGLLIAAVIVWLTQSGAADLTRRTFQVAILISIIPAVLAVLVLAVEAREVAVPGNARVPRLSLRGMDGRFKVFLLVLVRLAWRATHRPPAAPPMPAWQQRASQMAHAALYALFFAVPLAGWAYSSAAGFPVVLFGVLPLPDFVAPDRALSEVLKPVHQWLAYALAAVIVLHVAAALKHHFVDRDGLLLRMMPSRRRVVAPIQPIRS